MKEGIFYKRKKRIVWDIIPMEEDAFWKKLSKHKPSELYHSFYSSETPCYFITKYNENGVWYYANNAADKTPKYKNYKKFHTELAFQGIELFSFSNPSNQK